MGWGSQAVLGDLRMHSEEPIEMKTDAISALRIACGVGSQKMRHTAVNQLWLQHKVAKANIVVTKVKEEDNLSDALTEVVGGFGIQPNTERERQDIHSETDTNQLWC